MPDKFESIIFPVLYDMSYEEAEAKGIFGDTDDLANTMDNDDTAEIDQANADGDQEPPGDVEEEPESEEEGEV